MPVFLNVIFYYLDQQFLLLWLWVHANRKLIKKRCIFTFEWIYRFLKEIQFLEILLFL